MPRELAIALAGAIGLAALRRAAALAPSSEYIAPDVLYPGGYKHTIDLRPDGTVWVSGRNDFGQLGDGTQVNRGTPAKVESAVRFSKGVPVKVVGLGPRNDPALDLLDGPTGVLVKFDYSLAEWVVRMDDGAGNVKVLSAKPEELQARSPLDLDVPAPNTMPPTGSRRRSGCRIADDARENVWVVHDDATRSLIQYPSSQACVTTALKVDDQTLYMLLPRYGLDAENYPLSQNLSAQACQYVQPCRACNTYDGSEVCPNDPEVCQPPLGSWQYGQCFFKFTPGMRVTTRQLLLTPQLAMNKRVGRLVQKDVRYRIQWEVNITPLTCQSDVCDSGNILGMLLDPQYLNLDGEAYAAVAGAFHSVFLWKDTSVWATGLNSEGQLGDNTTQNRIFPKYIMWGCQGVAAGYYHSVYLRLDGTVLAAGRNKEGQLGDGTFGSRATPVLVRGLEGVKQVAAGAYHTVYLCKDGTAWAAGSNSYGQLGDFSTLTRTVPVQVFTGIQSIQAGDYFSLFVKYDSYTTLTTLWAAGLFNSGLSTISGDWSPVQFYNESQVQMMSVAV